MCFVIVSASSISHDTQTAALNISVVKKVPEECTLFLSLYETGSLNLWIIFFAVGYNMFFFFQELQLLNGHLKHFE